MWNTRNRAVTRAHGAQPGKGPECRAKERGTSFSGRSGARERLCARW